MIDLNSWIVPFTFIPGIGMLILSTANRLQNVSVLILEILNTPHHIYENNLQKLLKRTKLFHRALVCFYSAIGLLAVAALLGGFEITFEISGLSFEKAITICGVICVIIGSTQLIWESVIAANLILYCEKTHERIMSIRK